MPFRETMPISKLVEYLQLNHDNAVAYLRMNFPLSCDAAIGMGKLDFIGRASEPSIQDFDLPGNKIANPSTEKNPDSSYFMMFYLGNSERAPCGIPGVQL